MKKIKDAALWWWNTAHSEAYTLVKRITLWCYHNLSFSDDVMALRIVEFQLRVMAIFTLLAVLLAVLVFGAVGGLFVALFIIIYSSALAKHLCHFLVTVHECYLEENRKNNNTTNQA